MLLPVFFSVWAASGALALWVAYCMHVAREKALRYTTQLAEALQRGDLETAKENATRIRDALNF